MERTTFTTKKIFLIGLVVYVITAIFSLGDHHHDEHFQILEFAALKLGLAFENDLAWEYHFQMRPALQPAMVVVLYRFLALFGLANPFFVAFLLRLISAIMSLWVIKLLVDLYQKEFKHDTVRLWFVVMSIFIWISLYNNVRFSSENWSGNLFMLGFVWLMQEKKPKLRTYLIGGALFGLAFVIRYQVALMVLGFGLWLLIRRKDPFGKLVLMALGFLGMFGLGVLIDRWFYGDWVLTTWNYLKWNILADRVSTFGIEPWYYYITQTIVDAVPPFSLIYVVSFLWMIIKRPMSAITWTILPFMVVHFIIGHKETRFMFPLLAFMPVVMSYFLDWVLDRYGADFFSRNKIAYWFKKLFWVTNVVMVIIVMFRPANNTIWREFAFYKAIKKPATVYYDKTSPFGEGLAYKFYMRPNVEVFPYEIMDTILPEPNRQVFIGTTDLKMVDKYLPHSKLIYRSYPEWMTRFNVNGWVDRTTLYYVLELKDE
ncbi:MAG TPA: hypothetical protein ENK85_07070 [Saprospiraceae bacterium]|nr:hypothetical protein [Saprospiraceae bacterium]